MPPSFPGPYLGPDGKLTKPGNTSRVSVLLGLPELQNKHVSSKTTKIYNPYTTGSNLCKAITEAQGAGELLSLDQIIRLLHERGEFARREGQEHMDSAEDYAVFVDTVQTSFTDLDRSVRGLGGQGRAAAVWSAVVRGLDRLAEHQWEKSIRWSHQDGQVNAPLLSAALAAGYSTLNSVPSSQQMKEALRKFDGLVDSEGFRVDRHIASAVAWASRAQSNAPRSGQPVKRAPRGQPQGNPGPKRPSAHHD